MRKTLLIALAAGVAGVAAAGAGSAKAQPYGYYPDRSADYAYRYAPPRAYDSDGNYTAYSYGNGSDGYNASVGYGLAAGLGAALLGAAISPDVLGHAPYDQYGPDPNGMVAPDGHRIKCKLTDSYNGDYGRYVTRRACW